MRTKKGTIMLSSKCTMCNKNNQNLLKNKTLGNLVGAKIPILGDIPLANTLF